MSTRGQCFCANRETQAQFLPQSSTWNMSETLGRPKGCVGASYSSCAGYWNSQYSPPGPSPCSTWNVAARATSACPQAAPPVRAPTVLPCPFSPTAPYPHTLTRSRYAACDEFRHFCPHTPGFFALIGPFWPRNRPSTRLSPADARFSLRSQFPCRTPSPRNIRASQGLTSRSCKPLIFSPLRA